MRILTSSSSGGECRNPSFGLATKAKGIERVRAKKEARELRQKEARELSQEDARESKQEKARESHHILPGV
jgi:hypothetical protein